MCWKDPSIERAFHDKTRFPLKGEHLDVACISCHGPFPGQPAKFKGLAFAQCGSCHADAHEGQLSKKLDCQSCHSVDGFVPARYDVELHQRTDFPLAGAHLVVGCNACHLKSAALLDKVPKAVKAELKRKKRPELFSLVRFELKASPAKCEACHADVHKDQLDARPCNACHVEQSFHQVKLDHARDTRFPLTGKHAAVACGACHGAPAANRPVLYKPLPMTCAGCHPDVHAGQLAPVPGQPTACERCHDTASWKAAGFQHQPPFTDYLLDGKHAAAKCEGCHRPVALGGRLNVVKYKPLPRDCESCHTDFHKGAFKGFEP